MTDHNEARQRLIDALNEEHNPSYWGADTRDAEQLVNDFAHELAEQQQAALPDVMERWSGCLHQDTITEVIDVIDPKAQR